jgi:polyhydroxyalkanoate synthase
MSVQESSVAKRGVVSRSGARQRREAQATAAKARPRTPTGIEDGRGAGADNVYRDADRLLHASAALLTLGISPISLLQAWQDWALHLAVSPGKQQELAAKGIEKFARLATFLGGCMVRPGLEQPCISPLPQDRRFQHSGWSVPPFSAIQQSFLLWQQWWHNATTGIPGVTARHERLVEFYSRQLLDVFSPSNFFATNPEVLGKTIREGGANLMAGFDNMIEDLARVTEGRGPAGAENFKPGHEVAVTPGEVVFRNELIELIQYRATTASVRAEPILIVPAWIMKYYILDLSPANSLVRYLVEQGFTVFCISWRNPQAEHRGHGLDDYHELGVMTALDVVSAITGANKIHGVGYCLGGTLLSIAAAAMARDQDDRLRSLSLFAAQVDFEEPGEIGLFIDESQVTLIEDVMWSEGYLDQRRMAGAFQLLRSQDLIWSRLVREYLMGERKPASDLMAWNADATRMPYRMHSEYLRKLFLGNDLAQGRYHVGDRSISVEDIKAPVFAVGTVTDHVAPWRSVFKLTHLLDTEVDFILTTGGHNVGIACGPINEKRSYRQLAHRNGDRHPDPDHWMSSAVEKPGSWWPAWVNWLRTNSTGDTDPVPIGGRVTSYRPICPAPGTYVVDS